MRTSRRQVIKHGMAGALALSGSAVALARSSAAHEDGALVIVRTDRGVRALDPRDRAVTVWDGPLPATAPTDTIALSAAPAAVATPVTEGAVGYWMSSPGGDAFMFRLDTGASSSWWWIREGGRAISLGLPANLEPAFPSGRTARWFHGATIDARHFGAGTLRLLAVDIETGEIVLDHQLDRRLELAATAVSDDGAIVAHIQSSTTGVAFWAADLRGGTRRFEAGIDEASGIAAASAIDLDVATDGDAALVATALTGDWPGAPGSAVHTMWAASPNAIRTTSLPGELLGIVTGTGP